MKSSNIFVYLELTKFTQNLSLEVSSIKSELIAQHAYSKSFPPIYSRIIYLPTGIHYVKKSTDSGMWLIRGDAWLSTTLNIRSKT